MPSVQLNDVLSLGQHRIWKRMAVKWCQASAGQQTLDVCCGSGDLAFRLAEAVGPSGQVYRFSSSHHTGMTGMTSCQEMASCQERLQ